ncbi:hypothetical protein CEP54_011458 [Fusarium duplospermum]|uniref:Heterokaryon incompatibility domain-containing protein n=1 Tax=Fusarium duplospermum TaxID=1325734 RepID=A0A428PE99_9HYPO|nr:hypothetical protein CEP54_011458 [Fusarium duplospermum]
MSYGWWPEKYEECGFCLRGMCIEIFLPGNEDAIQVLRFTIDSEDEQLQKWLQVSQTPSPDFLSQKKINEMNAKLDQYPLADSDFFPTRVIDLGADPGGEELKLVTKQESLHRQYAALSYCWGIPEEAETQFTTLKCNLKDRHSGFKLSKVSPVIRDAVTVCRTFGVRYLWVDAVCIIQDDDYDWEQESALMAMIFRDAYFVIAAAASESCNEGFLSWTRPFIYLPFQSKLKPAIQGSYRLFTVPPYRDLVNPAVFVNLETEDFTSSRWHSRAWVYQERVAAQRLLLFGRSGLSAQFQKDPSSMIRVHQGEGNLNYKGWFRILSEFSTTRLTCQTDRLPAVSGLAKRFQEVFQDEYLAGLWRNDLCRGLFWQSDVADCSRQELLASLVSPDPYIAPSWSWARDLCPVAVHLAHILNLWQELEALWQEFALVDVKMELDGSNPYGELRYGQLTLRSKALEVPSSWDFEEKPGGLDGKERIIMEPDWDYYMEGEATAEGLTLFLLGSCIIERPRQCYCRQLSAGTDSLSEEIPHNIKAKEEQTVAGLAALGLGDLDHVERDQNLCLRCKEQVIMYGLVLHPAKEPGKFFRVGIFCSDPNTHVLGGMKLCEDWETRTVEII